MGSKTEEKILAPLEKIESLLTSFVLTVPEKDDPTEEEILSFVETGRTEHQAGKTKKRKSFSALR